MKEEKKTESSCCVRKTSIGGQALMEGIMMRGPKKSAMAVRNPKGEIVLEEFETKGVKRPKICKLPVIRGIFAYIDSMVVGYKCLMRSAEISGLDEIVEESPRKKKNRETNAESTETFEKNQVAEETAAQNPDTAEKAESAENTEKKEEKLPAWVMTLTMVVSVVFGFGLAIGLFVALPSFLYGLLFGDANTGSDFLDSLIKSVFEGVTKIILLVGYMGLISLEKDIRRTFMYHGAEHKTIFCYEAGEELTVENVRRQRRFHPRCGTSFLILMLLVSIVISLFIDPISTALLGEKLPISLRVVVKLLLIPLIVGLGYELIKFAGRHDNILTKIISAPGMWLQHITVFEPTDDMIECAIAAVKEVIPEDDSDKW